MGIGRTLILVLAAIVVGAIGYQIGLSQAVATALPAMAPGALPAYYYPHVFGFGFFGLLFPILFLFLIFGLGRALFWGGRWGGYRYGPGHHGGDERQQAFEEWHRRQHGETTATDQRK